MFKNAGGIVSEIRSADWQKGELGEIRVKRQVGARLWRPWLAGYGVGKLYE